MSTGVIIANILGLIAFIIGIFEVHYKKKKMFILAIFTASLKLIHYIILNAYSGMVTKILAIIRNLAILGQDKYKFLKSKWILLIFVIVYIVFGFITYKGILSLFSIFAALIYTIVSWNGREKEIRQVILLSETLWFIYNIFVKSYSGALSNFVMIVSTSIALYRNRRKNND